MQCQGLLKESHQSSDTVVRSYRCKFHTLSLTEVDGQLIDAVLTFDSWSDLDAAPDQEFQ